MADIDLLSFLSDNPIDKIVFPTLTTDNNEITIVNDGDTTSLLGGFSQAKIVEDTRPNPYGRAALARARWSIDGGDNWQALESKILYGYNLIVTGIGTFPNGGLDSAISIGCDDSTVYFRTANGRHGNVTQNPMSGATSYTPTSRTFLIQYWLYERK